MPLAGAPKSGRNNQGNQTPAGHQGNIKTLKDAGKVQRSRGPARSPADPNHRIIKRGQTPKR